MKYNSNYGHRGGYQPLFGLQNEPIFAVNY
jgi:hypothetical protein